MFKSLKTPILIGFLFTITIALFLSLHWIQTYYHSYQAYTQAEKILPAVEKLERLTNTLAEERGLFGAQKLSTQPTHLKAQLQLAFQQTDHILSNPQLISILKKTPSPLNNHLNQFHTLRKKAHNFNDYSQLIAQLIEIHNRLLNQAIRPLFNTNLMTDINNLETLIKVREYSGQERGLIMHALFKNKLTTKTYLKTNGLIQLQNVQLNTLFNTFQLPEIMHEEISALQTLKQQLNPKNFPAFQNTRTHLQNQFILQQHLLELLKTIGYTGFIHHYKNYLLRGQMAYYQSAKQDLKLVHAALNQLSNTPHLSPKQKHNIQTLQTTLKAYENNLEMIKLTFAQGMNTQQIDKKVHIDDHPVQQAINQLQHFTPPIPPKTWWTQASARIQYLSTAIQFYNQDIQKEVIDNQRFLHHQLLIISTALFLSLLTIILIVRYLFKRIVKLNHLSSTLQSMAKTQQFSTVEIDGKDEISSLGDSFNQLIKEREIYENELWQRSNLDTLTQLPNRHHLFELLDLFIQSSKRQNRQLAVLFIDLDGFKTLNDTKGHDAGDQLLKVIAQRLKAHIRQSDIAARLGGDEFVVLLPNTTSIKDVEAVAQKLIQTIAEPVSLEENIQATVSASIGISLFPDYGDTPETLLIHADIAMYEAKSKGKNQYILFQPEFEQHISFEQQIKDALSLAVKTDTFEESGLYLTYQPIVDTQNGEIAHFEALIRWEHPTLGFLPPDKFISTAERSRHIIPLGNWIIEQVANQITAWQEAYHRAFHVSINLSPVQAEKGFESVLNTLEQLKTHNFPVHQLDFEITESLLMQNTSQIKEGLLALQAYGSKIYLDDFGTGYSSLSYLKLYPLDVLKIDRSFIIDVLEDPQDQELVKTILSIAKVLNLAVVAEGVETEAQWHYLKEHGCDYIQGYYISKPLKPNNIKLILS